MPLPAGGDDQHRRHRDQPVPWCLRLPPPLQTALPFSSHGPTTSVPECSLPPPAGTPAVGLGRLLPGFPGAGINFSGRRRASQVPGEPPCVHALLFDPGGTDRSRPYSPARAAFRHLKNVGSRNAVISRLNHTACTLAVYASPRRRRLRRKTRFRLVANLCRAGLPPAGLHTLFQSSIPRRSSQTTKLCLAH